MPPKRLIDRRFEIGERVGAGGMGVVFRARDRHTGLEVAVKVLHDELVDLGAADEQRFEREAAVLAELSHSGIVRHVASGFTDEGRRYLATEWVAGETLYARLQRRGFTVDEVVRLGVALGESLGELHRVGLVHRDVKPSNVLFVDDSVERIKLIDFGIVRRRSQPLTRTGTMLGTPGYMAPEQARGDREVDARADVFAAGCVLYQCLAGQTPFSGGELTAVLAKILLVDPPPVRTHCPEAPAALEELLARALSKQRAERPADGAALASALAAVPAVGAQQRRPGLLGNDEPTMGARPGSPRPAPARVGLFVILLLEDEAGAVSEDELQRRCAPFHAEVKQLPFGAIAIPLAGGADEAARCALAVRAAAPRAIVVLAGGGRLEAALDSAFRELTAESMARAGQFPDRLRDAIRLDESTAIPLAQTNLVAEAGGRKYLMP